MKNLNLQMSCHVKDLVTKIFQHEDYLHLSSRFMSLNQNIKNTKLILLFARSICTSYEVYFFEKENAGPRSIKTIIQCRTVSDRR